MTDTITLDHRATLLMLTVLRDARKRALQAAERHEDMAREAETAHPEPAADDPFAQTLGVPSQAEHAAEMRAMAQGERAEADQLSRIIDIVGAAL